MDFNKLTEKLQEAIREAQSKAVRRGNQQVDAEHLLAALLEQEGGLAPSILNKADINVDALAAQLQDEGAKSFVKSWNELMSVIESKSATLK